MKNNDLDEVMNKIDVKVIVSSLNGKYIFMYNFIFSLVFINDIRVDLYLEELLIFWFKIKDFVY